MTDDIPENEADEILRRLGAATIEVWNRLPRDIQRLLFEIAAEDSPQRPPGELRQQVALFLHQNKLPDIRTGNEDFLPRD